MYSVLTLITFFLLIIEYRTKYGALSPVTFFMAPWAVAFLLLALPLFNYDDVLHVEQFFYLLAILLSFWFGSIIIGLPKKINNINRKVVPKRLRTTIAVLGILGQFSIIYDSLYINGVNFVSLFKLQSSEIRLAYFENINQGIVGPLSIVETLFVPFSYLSVIFTVYYISTQNKNLFNIVNLLGVICGVLVLFNASFIQGGRFGIIYLVSIIFFVRILVSYISLDIRKPSLNSKKLTLRVSIVFMLIVGTWYFSIPYMENRVDGADPEEVLIAAHRTTVDPLLKDIISENSQYGYLMLSLSYFSSSIPTLLYYLNLEEIDMPGPYFGAYSFPFIYSPLKKLFGDFLNVGQWIDIRNEVQSPLISEGHFPNSWSTVLRDLIADFGYIGSIVIIFIIGILSKLAYRYVLIKQTSFSVGLYAAIMFGLIWMAFNSVFYVSSYSLLVIYILMLISIKFIIRQITK